MPSEWLLLERVSDAAHVTAPDCHNPLCILADADRPHQQGGQDEEGVISREMLVEDVRCCQHLDDENLKVAQPELVVMERVGSDAVRAAAVQEKEGCPEWHEPMVAQRAAQGEESNCIDAYRVSEVVCQPQRDPQEHGGPASPDSGKGQEEDMQAEAEEQQDLDGPTVPEVQWVHSHFALANNIENR